MFQWMQHTRQIDALEARLAQAERRLDALERRAAIAAPPEPKPTQTIPADIIAEWLNGKAEA